MGLRINTNVASLNAQRNLQNTSKSLGRALERLSSGSRINRAGDDAAGLAISEGLQAQVRGLRVAVRNANDSLGFLNTAEGALGEITNITQRLRELAIQSANGAIGNRERGFLNDESEALLQEFNRIAVQTDFNGTKLLDGSFAETNLQVGVNKGETISFNIGDARTTALGALAVVSGAQNNLTAYNSFTIGAASTAADIVVQSTFDQVSNFGRTYSAIAVSKAINAQSGVTGVQATSNETIVRINDILISEVGGSLVSGELNLNGFDIVGSAASVNDLVDLVNSYSSSTGVKARLQTGSADDIELFAVDGRNIDIDLSAGVVSAGASTINAAFNNASNVRGAGTANRLFTSGTLLSVGASTSLVASVAGLFTGSVELRSSKAIILSGTFAATVGFANSVTAVDTSTAVFSISIATQAKASNSLANIDATLQQLNKLRSSLGAVQNRLESTIRNTSIGLENISSAQSQIRDADIASETADLTRAQILQQAGIAVLGQANTSAQVALSLLKF